MNIEQLTNIALDVVIELEPSYNYDVFDVTDSYILVRDEYMLFKICLSDLRLADGSLRKKLKDAIIKLPKRMSNY
jgi:hypothetical protein